ncbi:hypothetical protein D918_05682 [Trichuris suis]|nr:hypothetical protein D918_05682 [Trichuris suis]
MLLEENAFNANDRSSDDRQNLRSLLYNDDISKYKSHLRSEKQRRLMKEEEKAKGKARKQNRRNGSSSRNAQEGRQTKTTSREKVDPLLAQSDSEVDIEAQMLIKQLADVKKEDQGMDTNLAEGDKQRKQEAVAEQDSDAAAANLVALRRRSPQAAAGIVKSEVLNVNIQSGSVEPKAKAGSKKRTAVLAAEDEAAGIDEEAEKIENEDQNLDMNLPKGSKRRKLEAAAVKESAAIEADLIALRRRSPEAATGMVQSEVVNVSIKSGSVEPRAKPRSKKKAGLLAAESQMPGADVEGQKLRKQGANIKKKDQGRGINLAETKKRRK